MKRNIQREKNISLSIRDLTDSLNLYWNFKYFKLAHTLTNKPIIVFNTLPPNPLISINTNKKEITDKILSEILHTEYDGSIMLNEIKKTYDNTSESWNKFVEIMHKANKYNNRHYNIFANNKFETYNLLLHDNINNNNKNLILDLLKNITYNFQLLGIQILKYYKNILIPEQKNFTNIINNLNEYLIHVDDYYTDEKSINSIYFIMFNLINYKTIRIKYTDTLFDPAKTYYLYSAKSIFSDINKLISKIFSGRLFVLFKSLLNDNINTKNFIKEHRGVDNDNLYPLHRLFEIIYNIYYTSKYIHNQFYYNAIKLKKIIPDSSNKKFITRLRTKFTKYDGPLRMGLNNNFGFKKLESVKKNKFSDLELRKLNFGINEIKALKKLYTKSNNNTFTVRMFNKAKKIFYKQKGYNDKLLKHNIQNTVTSNFSNALFRASLASGIKHKLNNIKKDIDIHDFVFDKHSQIPLTTRSTTRSTTRLTSNARSTPTSTHTSRRSSTPKSTHTSRRPSIPTSGSNRPISSPTRKIINKQRSKAIYSAPG